MLAGKAGQIAGAIKKDGDIVTKECKQCSRIVVEIKAKGGTEVVERAMSKAELEATRSTGLVRGGREGTHYVSDAVNHDPLRARQRLSLGQTPEVRVKMEVPEGSCSSPSKVAPAKNMPGSGIERTGTGNIPAKVIEVQEYGR